MKFVFKNYRLLTAHPEYQSLFPAFANVPLSQLINNANLQVRKNHFNKNKKLILSLLFNQSMSVKVFARLSELIDSLGNPERLISKLIDLANEQKRTRNNSSSFRCELILIYPTKQNI